MQRKRALSLLFLFLVTDQAFAKYLPKLEVKAKTTSHAYTVSDLAKLESHFQLTLREDAHGKKTKLVYSVVPVKAVFAGVQAAKIADNASILFVAEDGFSGSIKASRLLDETKGHSHAYIAYELPKSEQKLGPFYLVWENPKASRISTEEWPFSLVSLEVKDVGEVEYPKMQPDASIKPDDPIRKGLALFQKNCFVCHTLNHEGTSHVGPDLNIPFNPTEYFKEGFFEKYVRNIQEVHYFPQAKMNAFTKDAISDDELTQIRAYLEYMAKHKITK